MEEQVEKQRMKSRIENTPALPRRETGMVERSLGPDPFAGNEMRPIGEEETEVKKERNIETYVHAVHKTR